MTHAQPFSSDLPCPPPVTVVTWLVTNYISNAFTSPQETSVFQHTRTPPEWVMNQRKESWSRDMTHSRLLVCKITVGSNRWEYQTKVLGETWKLLPFNPKDFIMRRQRPFDVESEQCYILDSGASLICWDSETIGNCRVISVSGRGTMSRRVKMVRRRR